MAAGQRTGLIAKRRKQVYGVSQRRRPVVAELARDHGFPPFVLWRLNRARTLERTLSPDVFACN
jgi:hypothetical protein